MDHLIFFIMFRKLFLQKKVVPCTQKPSAIAPACCASQHGSNQIPTIPRQNRRPTGCTKPEKHLRVKNWSIPPKCQPDTTKLLSRKRESPKRMRWFTNSWRNWKTCPVHLFLPRSCRHAFAHEDHRSLRRFGSSGQFRGFFVFLERDFTWVIQKKEMNPLKSQKFVSLYPSMVG